MDWKKIKNLQHFYKISPNLYTVKVINTQQLETYPSQEVSLGSVRLFIHTSKALTTVGYEISIEVPATVIVQNKLLLVEKSGLNPCSKLRQIFEDPYLLVFKSKDVIFVLKED